MSRWDTHALCGPCYDDLEPGREPVRLNGAELESCCRCGFPTRSGIYHRAELAQMPECTRPAGHDLLVGLEKPATGHGRERASQQQWPG